MSGKIKELKTRELLPIVCEKMILIARDGLAKVVSDRNGNNALEVTHHASHVDWLETGDTVLVRIMGGKVIVEYRLLSKTEKPRKFYNIEEEVQFKASRILTLGCGESYLKLLPNGKMIFKAREITALADETLALQGASIRLNCDGDL